MSEIAAILANDQFMEPFAKTTHGLIRGPSRYRIAGVIDASCAGRDAGELLDGRHRGIPIYDSLRSLINAAPTPPTVCVVGVATVGGVLPDAVAASVREAIELGLTLVNGLHQLLSEDAELAELAAQSGSQLIDIRRPKPVAELHFWTGEVLRLKTPRIAVLGTDCALGKRTTCNLLVEECRQRGLRSEMIYTGQTGWLQGIPHGFILDATPNDFVCGELEHAILRCHRELEPDLIFLEGQSGLRNPSGPCGSELLLAAGAHGVILQHAPGRKYYEGLEEIGCEIPPLEEEIDLLRLLDAELWALTLNAEGLDDKSIRCLHQSLGDEFGVPVAFPLSDGVEEVADAICERLHLRGGA